MVGLLLVGHATNDFSSILFGYLTDPYASYAAPAYVALSLFRTTLAAVPSFFRVHLCTIAWMVM